MAKTVNYFYEQINNIRTGNVTSGVIETVRVESYGQKTPLKHIAMVTGGQGKPILIQPYDSTLVAQINRDLLNAGFSSYIFSKDSVCVNVPPMSGDEREKISKYVKGLGEESKVAIRNIRKQCKKSLKDLPDGERNKSEKELQKHTNDNEFLIIKEVEGKIKELQRK